MKNNLRIYVVLYNIMENTNIILSDNIKKFKCTFCDYNTCNKRDYSKHLLTLKHKKLFGDEEYVPKLKKSVYECNCGKKYKHSSSLWNHKKICNNKNNVQENDLNVNKDEIILNLLKQNSTLIDIIKVKISSK